jgi:dTDP-4-amino-4,6-dideoxygalactose transaminase
MITVRQQIPITKPYITEDEAQAAATAIRSGWIVQGPQVTAFEQAVAAYVGARHAVATTNCTTALHLALLCSGVGPGDEVIVPSFTFIATANVVLHAGATPVFVDIDPRTYNMDPALLEAAITPRTRAIMPVDQIGLAADLDPILEVAARHNLRLIEDAAPAIGATYHGRRVGSISPLTCFSFHPRKSITTGEGGMITTDDDALAARARVLRSHGASISDLARHQAATVMLEEYGELGYNYRMTDIQAAVGIEQLKKVDWILERRRSLGERYTRLLAGIPGITPPYAPAEAPHTYQSYAVRLDPALWPPRDEVMGRMLARGIATRRGVMAIHLEPYYQRRFGRIDLPVTEEATRQTMLLPLYATLTEDEQDAVLDALQTARTVEP